MVSNMYMCMYVCMCVVGKMLAVGSEDGSVALLDLESSNCVSAMTEELLPCSSATTSE